MDNNIQNAAANLINTAANNAEIVNELYQDAVKPVAQQVGHIIEEPLKGVSRVGRLLNALCSGMDCWILKKEAAIKETQLLIEKRLKNIADEDIQIPEGYIAIPAIQALSYSFNSKQLRKLYANLLAKAMYKKTADKIHPAYTEIIKQLSPLDAVVLDVIKGDDKNEIAVCSLCTEINDVVSQLFVNTLTAIELESVYRVSESIDNLVRCGLIKESPVLNAPEKEYDAIKQNPKVIEFISDLKTSLRGSNEKIKLIKKQYEMTNLGCCFYEVCCTDIE